MVAVSRDLTRQGCNAIPNYRIRVLSRPLGSPQKISTENGQNHFNRNFAKVKPINSLEVITKDVSVKHSGTGEFLFCSVQQRFGTMTSRTNSPLQIKRGKKNKYLFLLPEVVTKF